MTFHADAGTTYYFQLAALYGNAGPATFNLSVAPDPQANFWYWPGDPSTYDTIQFSDASYDPGQVGIQAEEWAFGDGSTATGCCPTHRYSADNDYTATLTVATSDGRHASIRRTIHVQTHDVAITKLLAPQSASAGQTRQISVGVASNRYPEDVQVQLMKALPGGGYAVIGTLTQSVPVRSSNRTTSFDFSYTFTSDDASVGKVTFKAVASIVGARDALPGDNELVADPTKVTR
jgi:PKD repeat protein